MDHGSDSEAVEQVLASLADDDNDLGSTEEMMPEREQVEELLKRLEAESLYSSQDYAETVSMAVDDDPEITINLKPKHIHHKTTSQQSTPNSKLKPTSPPKTYNNNIEPDTIIESINTASASASGYEDEQPTKSFSTSSSLTRTPLKDLNGITTESPASANGKHHQPTTPLKREPSTTDANSLPTTSATTSRKSPSPPKEQLPKPWKLKAQPKFHATDDIIVAAPSGADRTLDDRQPEEPPTSTKLESNPKAETTPVKATATDIEKATAVSKSPNPSVNTNKQSSITTNDDASAGLDHAKLLESIRREVTNQISQEVAFLEMEFNELRFKYDREVRGNTSLKSTLYEYEQTIKKLIDGAGAAAKDEALAERVASLEAENRRKASEAEAMEVAFNDLKTRYEELKLLNEKLKTNEQILKDTVARQNQDLQTQESRFDKLKLHAENKLDSASERLAQVKSDAAREVALITAKLLKAESRVTALEEQVQEKELKNKELLSICDDLLARIEKKCLSHSFTQWSRQRPSDLSCS